jgi:putative hydrolase
MILTGDYHTHTVYSHGKGTIRQNVEAAIKKGLKEIAITDHGPEHLVFKTRRDNFFKMRKEIDELNEEYSNINILLGVEANIVDYSGNIDVDQEILDIIDILLVGYHYGTRMKRWIDIYRMYVMNLFSVKRIRQLNSDAIIGAIKKYNVDIITHLGDRMRVDIKKIAKVAKEYGTMLEINASPNHGQLNLKNLNLAKDTGVKFVINSDAHSPERVGEVSRAMEVVKMARLDRKLIYNVDQDCEWKEDWEE